MYRPVKVPSQINSRRVGFIGVGGSQARCRNLFEHLLEHLFHRQAFDVQFRGDPHSMPQHGHGAAFDVIGNHEFAATQQGSGTSAAYQGNGSAGPAPRVRPGQLRVARARRTA